jgi:hypothetical protein
MDYYQFGLSNRNQRSLPLGIKYRQFDQAVQHAKKESDAKKNGEETRREETQEPVEKKRKTDGPSQDTSEENTETKGTPSTTHSESTDPGSRVEAKESGTGAERESSGEQQEAEQKDSSSEVQRKDGSGGPESRSLERSSEEPTKSSDGPSTTDDTNKE